MIKSIELVNWKTHKRTVMNFQKGVNVLVGVMGAGKSSVIDGISFGLFGTFPSLVQRRTNTNNLISNRQTEENNAEVKICFTVGSDEYVVTRRISKTETTSAKLQKNGGYLQAQPARVNEEVESLIKVNYDTFSRAIYAEQNKIDYFLELTKGDRKKQIDQMLGLDTFAKAEENATSLINSIKSMIADEEQLLSQTDIKEMKSQLEKLTNEKQTIQKEQLELTEKEKEMDTSITKLQKESELMKSKYDQSKKLEKEINELSSKIDTLDKELKKITGLGLDEKVVELEFSTKTKEIQDHEEKTRKLRKEESEITKIMAEAEALVKLNQKKAIERDKLQESIQGKSVEALEKSSQESKLDIQNSSKEISALKGRKDDVKKWIGELEEHISKCPVCEKELDDTTRKMLLDQKNSLIKELDANISTLETTTAKKEKEFDKLLKELEIVKLATAKLSDYNEVDDIIKKNSSAIKEHKEKCSVIAQTIEKSSKESEKLNKELNEINIKRESVKRKAKYDVEIKESQQNLEKKKKDIKGEKFDEKEFYKIQELITKDSALKSDVSGKIKSNERYSKSIDVQIEDKTKGIASLIAMQDRIESRRNQIGNMNRFKTALVETEAELRNSLVTSINALMQNIWSDLYPYNDYTGIRLDAKRDDYLLEACTDGNDGKRTWIEIDGIASGGERSTACLALRIALAMVIVPNLRWLILDEPTHNIDENGISKFIEVLGNSLPKVVEQIFIITHDNALKNISSARIYSLERNKNKNEYTSVVES